MNALTWEQAKQEFVFDGSLRDLYVLDTDLDNWEQMLQWVQGSAFSTRFWKNGEPAPSPEKAPAIFDITSEAACVLQICIGEMWLNCHFFTTEEIEFDLDPRDVMTEESFNALLRFMQGLGQALRRSVIFTPEGFWERPIFTVKPHGTLEYLPHGGWTPQTLLHGTPLVYDLPLENQFP